MKRKIKQFAAVALGAALIGACAAAGCSSPKYRREENVTPPPQTDGETGPVPDDGSKPTDYTGLQNLQFLAARLAEQSAYRVYAYCAAKASIATQVTVTYKDYKEGVMVCSDITYTQGLLNIVNGGTQTCVVGGKAYVRETANGKKCDANTRPATAPWSEEAPAVYTQEQFSTVYGLFPTGLSNYVLNEATVLSCGEVQAVGDGTYTQSFVLDPVGATYYYQYSMKTHGNLKRLPEFESVSIQFTFDEEWRVIKAENDEVSTISPAALPAATTNTLKMTVEFYYGGEEIDGDHFAFYGSYFASHASES